jgi:hypothetical protein
MKNKKARYVGVWNGSIGPDSVNTDLQKVQVEAIKDVSDYGDGPDYVYICKIIKVVKRVIEVIPE